MISFDFAYFKPQSIEEAVQIYHELHAQQKQVQYYAGGTEFISRARLGQVFADAVIDLKAIPECNAIEHREDRIVIGATVSLSALIKADLFPLLSQHCKGIADHTSRNRITLGGNIAGSIVYREAVLPLLICDSLAVIAGANGRKTAVFHDIFDGRLRLQEGEFIVQLLIDRGEAQLPFVSLKKTRCSKIDYPLVSLAAVRKDEQIRFALSGICGYPFRSKQLEAQLNAPWPLEVRIRQAMRHLPGPIISDELGSSEYRRFVLKHAVRQAIRALEGEQSDVK